MSTPYAPYPPHSVPQGPYSPQSEPHARYPPQSAPHAPYPAQPAPQLGDKVELTQEDFLFINKWKRDTFIQRGLPFTAITCGAQYFYNQSKNLPHGVGRYGGLILLSNMAGVIAFKGEFRKRVAASNSNSPFMMKIRETLGLPPVVNNGFDADNTIVDPYNINNTTTSFSNPNEPGTFGYTEEFKSDWDTTPNINLGHNHDTVRDFYGNQSSVYPGPPPPPPSMRSSQPDRDPMGSHVGGGVSYDELRARNRGLMR